MRSSKSRSRSKNNRNRSMGNIVNRVFESSGPEGKVRGTPQQIIDKYAQLTRDAQLSNDRVAAENFQQHAEHYLRMLGEAQREADQRREQYEQQNRERGREAQNRDDSRGDEQPAQQTSEIALSEPAPGTGEQPATPAEPAANAVDDVLDVAPAPDAGLVETPESAPDESRPRAPRRSRGRTRANGTDAKRAEPAPAEDSAPPDASAENGTDDPRQAAE